MNLTDPATLAAFTSLTHATFGDPDTLRALLTDCDRDIAHETANQLGIPVPDCARPGWRP